MVVYDVVLSPAHSTSLRGNLKGRGRDRDRGGTRYLVEVPGSINQESAWVENVVSEVRSHIRNKLRERYSAQLQSLAYEPKRVCGQTLPPAARKSNQFAFRRRVR